MDYQILLEADYLVNAGESDRYACRMETIQAAGIPDENRYRTAGFPCTGYPSDELYHKILFRRRCLFMRWFDSDYDYVQELKEAWERGKKKIRNAYLILAAVLLAAGILLAVFPTGIFALIQYIAAIAVIMVGIYHFISYASMTYYFRDPMLLVSGILNVLLGVLLSPYAGGADSPGYHLPAGFLC